ncbi:MAG: 2-amino-4-hydroxy-6-hydroxymethyldihydropteridine diphosphokinase [Bacteroidales bacterium]|nr:2-amino-4-hydroxy-6-hydroxymethyldihydropteridine diphosphokinase [Bacteroidales bacterium]
MERVDVYLSLGTNLGERDLNLIRAMNLLDEAFGMHPERISHIVETPAWGFEGPAFLNMCVLYRPVREGSIEEQGLAILRKAKAIEKAMGREGSARFDEDGKRVYEDRVIDIDILCVGAYKIETEELTVPHPLIGQRDFMKKPLLEISKPEIRNAFPDIFA